MRLALFGLLVSLVLAGCAANFAPPVRSLGYGPPCALPAGTAEVGAGTTLPWFTGGGPLLSVAATDWLRFEGGGDFSPVMNFNWAEGYLGLRVATPYRKEPRWYAFDAEMGGGGGVGGATGSLPDPAWRSRPTFGVYGGGGAALWLQDDAAVFARGRAQFDDGSGLPRTLWLTGLGGVAFKLHLATLSRGGEVGGLFYVAAGVAAANNFSPSSFVAAPSFEAGLCVSFPLFRPERPSPAEAPPAPPPPLLMPEPVPLSPLGPTPTPEDGGTDPGL